MNTPMHTGPDRRARQGSWRSWWTHVSLPDFGCNTFKCPRTNLSCGVVESSRSKELLDRVTSVFTVLLRFHQTESTSSRDSGQKKTPKKVRKSLELRGASPTVYVYSYIYENRSKSRKTLLLYCQYKLLLRNLWAVC